jgi:hypothetical protein
MDALKKITVISGASDDTYRHVESELGKLCSTEVFRLRELDIKYCCGCWDCWVKTPGVCRYEDDMPQILRRMINSDLCIWVSPLRMGFVSALTKKAMDRIIPLVHPYIGVFEGEFHHLKRYSSYPKLGLILLGDTELSPESHEIVTGVYRRLGINSKGELLFSLLTDGSLKEVEHAISSL